MQRTGGATLVADAGKRNFSASVRMCRLNREQRVSFGMAAAVGIISPQPDSIFQSVNEPGNEL
jgi:hypothetical protein